MTLPSVSTSGRAVKTWRLAGLNFVCAAIGFSLALFFGASMIGMEEPASGKGRVVLWIGMAALLARSVLFLLLQQTRLRARVEELSHPQTVVALAGFADGVLLVPLFAAFGHVFFAQVANPPVESVFVVLLAPIALLAAMFPIAVNLVVRGSAAGREVGSSHPGS